MLEHIFTPLCLGPLQLKNRLAVSAMVTGYANEDGTVTEQYIAYHERKARGGWGLVITEDYPISPEAGAFKRLPALYSPHQLESHRELTRRIHAAGGCIVAQLYHGGRAVRSAVSGVPPVTSSAVPELDAEPVHPLTEEEIRQIVTAFGESAARAREAGYDGVEIHGAHGYLIGQFLSPWYNRRTDGYGGSLENRMRLALEVAREVRRRVGPDFPLLYRLSVQEYVEGGITREETVRTAQALEAAGVTAIHCSQGNLATRENIIPPYYIDPASYRENAACVKRAVKIPVLAAGRINDVTEADQLLAQGVADIAVMARASLADPDLPIKAREGRLDEITPCIGCLQGCIEQNGKGGCVRCLVNPANGLEGEHLPETTAHPRTILVAGGGIAGCEAAITAAAAGHRVTVCEKSNELGGQWRLAARPRGKSGFTGFLRWQKARLEALGVPVLYNTPLSRELLDRLQPDVLILATGSNQVRLPVPGMEDALTADEVLSGRTLPGSGVLVVGGGQTGAETAEYLADRGYQVSLVELAGEIVAEGFGVTKDFLLRNLRDGRVQVYTGARVTGRTGQTVTVETENGPLALSPIDWVVMAAGRRPDTSGDEVAAGWNGTVLRVGDAAGIKNGYRNIRQGYEAVITLA